MRSFEELRAEEAVIGDELEYINKHAGGIFLTTAISLEDAERQEKSRYYALYRECKFKLLAVREEMLTDHRERFSFDRYMDACFLTAADYAFLGELNKMDEWASRIDWTRWSVQNSENSNVITAYWDLRGATRERQGGHFRT